MARPRFPCKYHSEKLSTKKCYFCKEYICSSCQIHSAHHIFCSIWCIAKYFIKYYLTILISLFKFKKYELDGIIGGPPCQGFSYIGKNNNADPRNELFVHFFRTVAALKPTFFLVENVGGDDYDGADAF